MKLTPRLAAVAAFVLPCTTAADIGTDHAYIPIYLIEKGIASFCFATDVAQGPANIAAENVNRHGLGDKIRIIVCNGLDGIYNADTIVIAGMGGKLICEILQQGLNAARGAKRIILQPMTSVENVRRFLHRNSFTIYDEAIAKENNKLYNVIGAVNGKETVNDDFYYYIGKKLIEKKDKLLGLYIERKLISIERILESLSGNADKKEKYIRLSDLRVKLLEVKSQYDNCS